MSSPESVGVVGAGTMGMGIAQVFATIGSNVRVIESNAQTIAGARDRLGAMLRRAEELGKLKDSSVSVLARVEFGADVQELPDNVSLVVEAVPEDVGLKTHALAAVEKVVTADAVLASNTSSLSIAELASVLVRPQRFLGMHFFNPVPGSKLVEFVTSSHSDGGVVARVTGWVRLLEKTPIVVRDSPGFASSRLGVLLGLEAIRMVEEGVASPADIDDAMVLGYRHPMGPLHSSDLVGLDVRMAIADHLHEQLGERFRVPDLLREKVALGELGKKTGQGFFSWD